MPRRNDIESILLIGSGPIVIGQACEFDYSGTQACRRTAGGGLPGHPGQLEPGDDHDRPGLRRRHLRGALRLDVLEAIIARERPDALLPTLGGQTALNLAMELAEAGVLDRYERGAHRRRRRGHRHGRGPGAIQGGHAGDRPGDRAALRHRPHDGRGPERWWPIGLPVVIRPAYILGGRGTGIASTAEEFEKAAPTASRPAPSPRS